MFCKRTARHGRRFNFILLVLTAASITFVPKSSLAERFSIVAMPDPQYYTTSPSFNLYSKHSQWVVDNRALYNIKHVMWLGDLTNDNKPAQWNTASAAYTILDNANIPYAVIPGNHDYKPSTGWPGANFRNLVNFNITAGPSRFKGRPWYGGNMGETTNQNDNNYTYFSAGGQDFMVVGLEYAPRKEALTWANNLISAHPNHRVIIITHAYLTHNRKYTGGSGTATGTVGAHGSEVFDECASRHSNVFLVVCGHVGDSELKVGTGVAGNPIYEMLVDYQFETAKGAASPNLGNGWLRLLEFDTETNTIEASTLTVVPGNSSVFLDGITKLYLNQYSSNPTAIDHKFTLNYNLTAPATPYTYLNGSVAFHEMGVGKDLYSNQTTPDIAQADNGNWVTVWTDRDSNGSHNIYIRGFDADGNERFPKIPVTANDTKITTASKACIAMMPDGRFVVAYQSGRMQIKARAYYANGTPASTDFVVQAVYGIGTIDDLDIAMSDAGNYIVTWSEDADGDGLYQILARGFSFGSTQRFATKAVNTNPAGQHSYPRIAMAPGGDYVIVWEETSGGTLDVGMRGFTSLEAQKFAQTRAHSSLTGVQAKPGVAMDSNGRFVVIWEDDADLNGSYQVRARGFEATGAQRFSEKTVNFSSSKDQLNPEIAMDPAGNWYAAWEDNGVTNGEGFQILSTVFDSLGIRKNPTSDTQVNVAKSVSNKFSTPQRGNPVVSVHKSGRYSVAWADDMDGNGDFQALVRGMAGSAKSLVVKSLNGEVIRSPNEPFYAPDTVVSLTTVPNPGSSFIRWSGDIGVNNPYASTITVTMNASKNLTASFSATSDINDWQLYK